MCAKDTGIIYKYKLLLWFPTWQWPVMAELSTFSDELWVEWDEAGIARQKLCEQCSKCEAAVRTRMTRCYKWSESLGGWWRGSAVTGALQIHQLLTELSTSSQPNISRAWRVVTTELRLDNFKCGQRIRMTTKWRKYCRGQLDGGYGMDCDNEWGYSLFIMSLQSVPGDHWTIFRAAESGWTRITGDISERLLQINWTQSHIPRVDQS